MFRKCGVADKCAPAWHCDLHLQWTCEGLKAVLRRELARRVVLQASAIALTQPHRAAGIRVDPRRRLRRRRQRPRRRALRVVHVGVAHRSCQLCQSRAASRRRSGRSVRRRRLSMVRRRRCGGTGAFPTAEPGLDVVSEEITPAGGSKVVLFPSIEGLARLHRSGRPGRTAGRSAALVRLPEEPGHAAVRKLPSEPGLALPTATTAAAGG